MNRNHRRDFHSRLSLSLAASYVPLTSRAWSVFLESNRLSEPLTGSPSSREEDEARNRGPVMPSLQLGPRV